MKIDEETAERCRQDLSAPFPRMIGNGSYWVDAADFAANAPMETKS
jgi:hypothetical protein